MPARGRLIVKYLETEETFSGSRIILTDVTRERLSRNQMEVVSVGAPEICEWPDECDRFAHQFESLNLCVHPVDPRIIPGAWVVVRPRSLVEAGDNTYIIKQTDVLACFVAAVSEAENDRKEAERLTATAEAPIIQQA